MKARGIVITFRQIRNWLRGEHRERLRYKRSSEWSDKIKFGPSDIEKAAKALDVLKDVASNTMFDTNTGIEGNYTQKPMWDDSELATIKGKMLDIIQRM